MEKQLKHKFYLAIILIAIAVTANLFERRDDSRIQVHPSSELLTYKGFLDEYDRMLAEAHLSTVYPTEFLANNRRIVYNDTLRGRSIEMVEDSDIPILLGVLPNTKSVIVIFHGSPEVDILSHREIEKVFAQMTLSSRSSLKVLLSEKQSHEE